MPFVETNMEHETKELQAMIDADEDLQRASELFNTEYELRKKLVQARKKAGLTQKDLGVKSGLPYRAISRLETNADVSPNIRTMLKYLSALGYELEIVEASSRG